MTGKTGLLDELFSAAHFPLALSGDAAGARLSINGSIADVLSLADIDLEVQIAGSDLSAIGVALGTKLAQTRAFEMKAQLTGNHDNISVRQLEGSFDSTGIALAVTGSIGDLAGLSGMQIEVTASGGDLAKLGPSLSRTLPSSDPFRISADISDTQGYRPKPGGVGEKSCRFERCAGCNVTPYRRV